MQAINQITIRQGQCNAIKATIVSSAL